MTMKRFIAPDMRRALDLVRQELGPDAIILSSKRTSKGVEIITSTDLDHSTRGAPQNKEFSNKFDSELDQPLQSDYAWRAEQGVDEAVAKFTAPAAVKLDRSRSQQLADEIEAARERMLAAKRGTAESASAQRSSEELAGSQSAPVVDFQRNAKREAVTSHEDHSRAFEQQQAQSLQAEQLQGVDRQMAGLREQVEKMAAEHKRKQTDESNMNSLRDEIADMRMLLEQQMWKMRDGEVGVQVSSPLMDSLKSHLTSLGLPTDMVKKLALTAKPGQRLNAAWRSALAHLTKRIPIDNGDPINQGGIFGFVGPTGVGKTTTIAKLAARYSLKHGLGKVALITTDTFRVGAHDQLRSLGRILNVPVRVVDKERSLPAVIASLKDYPLILIDTAGFRHGDPLLREQEEILKSCPGLQRVLVLASNSQRQTLMASAHAFNSQSLRGCILTKIDETGSLGELLGVIASQRIPVLYSADGQTIPNDLSVASSANLVAKAVNLMKLQREAEKTFAAVP